MNVRLNFVAMKTIVRKEFGRVLRIWVQTIIPPAITMTLYFIIFGNLIGRRIGTMGGFDYMQYIAPGLIMMSVITNSYGNVVSSFFGAKFGRHIEEMIVSPMSRCRMPTSSAKSRTPCRCSRTPVAIVVQMMGLRIGFWLIRRP